LLLHKDGLHKGIFMVKLDILRAFYQDERGKSIIIDVNDKLTLKNIMKRRKQRI